jgi:hypothetical protein
METYNVQSIDDINSELQVQANASIEGLSTSPVAEWKLWTYIMAFAVRILQVIQSKFVQEVDNKLTFQRQGSRGWYAEMAKKFQYGYNLVLKSDNTTGYDIDDPTSRIVAVVAVIEEPASGTVKMKVARVVNGLLSEFTTEQRLAFSNYIESIKFVGTKIDITSTSADLIKYHLNVYYDPTFNTDSIKASVLAALNIYKESIGFDGFIYRQRLIDVVMGVTGVVTTDLVSLQSQRSGEPGFTDIGVKYEIGAGYFNYTGEAGENQSMLTLIPINLI